MNRILFETDEIEGGVVTIGDIRAEHILKVLHGEKGQELKVGVVDGPIGTGRIAGIEGSKVTIELELGGESLRPWFDLILAPPRPRVFKRLLPQLAALGMRKLTLIGAKKVEKDFWGATILKAENYRPLFIEGLQQAGTSILPAIAIERSFRKFLAGFEDFGSLKLVAHPYDADGAIVRRPGEWLTLAVGPEGGWTDDEVKAFEDKGFKRYSPGARILRSDTAIVALAAKFM